MEQDCKEGLDIEERVILEIILQKQVGSMDWIHLAKDWNIWVP
jgi:hypothetical protein